MTHIASVAGGAALLAHEEARTDRYARVAEVHSGAVLRQLKRVLSGSPWEEPIADRHWTDHTAVFAAAQGGDGQAVADILASQRSLGRDTLARSLPRLTRNTGALTTWFRERYPAPCTTCGASNMHGYLMDRREVARVLAAVKEREELTGPVKAFVEGLTDPDIAWELDELETFFAPGR